MATALVLSTPPHGRAHKSSHPKRPTLLRSHSNSHSPTHLRPSRARRHLRILALQETKEAEETTQSAEEITKKFGLEFGLWKIFSSKEGEKREGEGEGKEKTKADQAKELLAKYGGAYLATSITLSLISFALCYLLVSAGIDVQALLSTVGITTDETGGRLGTFALAYAAHKAASPIRFPPTVALTPLVASWIGKKIDKKKKDE